MRFAILNPDADAVSFAEALLGDGGHELLSYFTTEPTKADTLQSLAPGAKRIDEWEGVLAGTAQAVVVGTAATPEQLFEQLRRLVLENVPFAFVHPFGLASLEYHELDMNRQATKTAIVPYEPTRHHPAVDALVSLAGPEGIGRVEQIVVERQAKLRTRAASLRHFVRDIGMSRRIAGQCDKVSALGRFGDDPAGSKQSGSAQAGSAPAVGNTAPVASDGGHLGIQITTTDGVLIRWSIGPIVDGAGAKTTLVGSLGSAVVTMPESETWVLQIRRADVVETELFDEDGTKKSASAITAAIESNDDSLWREALADLELVEAVERSMRKGRTVELFHEEASEQGTFHGMMAAGGCALMCLAIGLAIVATVFGRFRFVIANYWPYALLFALGFFLLLQLLKLVFPTKPTDARDVVDELDEYDD